MQQDYAAVKQSWGGYAGYDRFFAQDLTNANLAAVGAYNDRVPAFNALLAQHQGDFPAFYAAVKRLAALSPEQRTRCPRWAAVSALASKAGTGPRG